MGAGHLVPIESNRPAKIGAMSLGQDGIAYVKDSLGQGGPLAALVAKLFEGHGATFAPLENGTTLERAKQFKTGTFMATAAIRKWLTDYIGSQWGVNSQLVLEEAWMKPEDIKPERAKQPYFFVGKTVYDVPKGDDLYAALFAGERQCRSWCYSVFVINPPAARPPTGEYASQEQLTAMAQNTQAVLASAYDHEGYVVWQK
jgi:hypothetical protein